MGTDQEKTLYIPQCASYKDLSLLLLQKSISIDLFIFSSEYTDLSTTSQLSTITGGNINFYPNFTPELHSEKLHYNLFRNITKSYSIDCILTLRTSPGLILEGFYTVIGNIQTRDVQISYLDPDYTLGIAYKQKDKIIQNQAYVQFAVLYSSLDGKRLIRVFNLALQVQNNIQGIFKNIDFDATFGLLIRKQLSLLNIQNTNQIKDTLIAQTVNILYSYRNYCVQGSSQSQLILPETLRMLPIIVQSLLKQEAFRFYQLILDDKICQNTPYWLNQWLYSKVYAIHNIKNETFNDLNVQIGSIFEDDKVVMPNSIPSTIDRIISNGVYIIDNGESLYIWIQKNVKMICQKIYLKYKKMNNQKEFFNYRVLLKKQYKLKSEQYNKLIKVKQNGSFLKYTSNNQQKLDEQKAKNLMVVDKNKDQKNYVDFLFKIQNLIQKKINLIILYYIHVNHYFFIYQIQQLQFSINQF
ncbi:sec23 sec24 trunk domain protein [Ichthyophthirius multifiliis]|uniref:Sec23 sec24 trunk domain protein n=1 Tax=Ichthyophthirius multifiliis TaxID=5932 RepID=G0QL31_ICHMU|nr:sec23 sec24 trunk domain protein [Ichthyophthirius multifiliis]EGR34087.1 sec23 sec24 trunk domain protein [Ichthyophthirius multifiliis]|eukprot:XP_004039391.1 sec23 sec24 trunk domain protein [Ichthyophthirius multifiliis]